MGIFDHKADVFTRFGASITFRNQIMGGTPMDPKLVEGWIGKGVGGEKDEKMKRLVLKTLAEMAGEDGEEPPDGADVDALIEEASSKIAGQKQTSGFKRDERGGLYIESRHIKSMLKEVVHILYAGEKWGDTKKGPKAFFAERVFVDPERIYLGIDLPDGLDLFVGHVTGPQGPRSTLTHYEFALGRTVDFDIRVEKRAVPVLKDRWPAIWVHAQENGLGALRSQGHGRFDITRWDVIERAVPEVMKKAKRQNAAA